MTNPSSEQLPCLVCGTQLKVGLSRGRKSGKPFVSLTCPVDGRHFRGFINDRVYVNGVLDQLEGHAADNPMQDPQVPGNTK